MTQICHYKTLKEYSNMGYSWGSLQLTKNPARICTKSNIEHIESLCGDTTTTEVNINLVQTGTSLNKMEYLSYNKIHIFLKRILLWQNVTTHLTSKINALRWYN